MNFTDIFLIGVGLSMDAFAVSVCKGLTMKRIDYKSSFIIALFFGLFQALMPFLGFFLGSFFESYITEFDHWIAFGLLLYIGVKMIYDCIFKKDDESEKNNFTLDFKELVMLSVATSIDALAVGITLSFYKGTPIFKDISIIGATTFVISFSGVIIGNKFGNKFKKKAEIFGGIILILIGLKILLEGLGLL